MFREIPGVNARFGLFAAKQSNFWPVVGFLRVGVPSKVPMCAFLRLLPPSRPFLRPPLLLGMSSPAPTQSPSSSPWLAPPFLLAIVCMLVSSGALWGVLTARMDASDRARTDDRVQIQATAAQVATLQVRLATVETDAAGTRRILETEVAGLRRDMERVVKAVERLTDSQPVRTSRRSE